MYLRFNSPVYFSNSNIQRGPVEKITVHSIKEKKIYKIVVFIRTWKTWSVILMAGGKFKLTNCLCSVHLRRRDTSVGATSSVERPTYYWRGEPAALSAKDQRAHAHPLESFREGATGWSYHRTVMFMCVTIGWDFFIRSSRLIRVIPELVFDKNSEGWRWKY